MNNNIDKSPNAAHGAAYAEKLAQARAALDGGRYCKDVRELVPTYSEHAIRNIVNGRGTNELVLAALLIVVGKRAKRAQAEHLRLHKVAERAGLIDAA